MYTIAWGEAQHAQMGDTDVYMVMNVASHWNLPPTSVYKLSLSLPVPLGVFVGVAQAHLPDRHDCRNHAGLLRRRLDGGRVSQAEEFS